MPEHKAQYAEQETTNDIRQPVHAKVHAQKPPRERQQEHHPAVLRHNEGHGARNGEVVHRMARREAVLVERRDFRLDLRVSGKRARTLGIELHYLVNHEAHGERHQGLPQDGQKVVEPDTPDNEQHEQRPYIAVTQAHVKLEPTVDLRRKMPVGPVHRNAVVKISDFLEHQGKCTLFLSQTAGKIPII